MDQGRALQRVIAALAAKMAVSQPAQLTIDQRRELVDGGLIARSPLPQQCGDVGRRLEQFTAERRTGTLIAPCTSRTLKSIFQRSYRVQRTKAAGRAAKGRPQTISPTNHTVLSMRYFPSWHMTRIGTGKSACVRESRPTIHERVSAGRTPPVARPLAAKASVSAGRPGPR